MPISTRAILLRRIGHHSVLILDGNLSRISKTPTRLPHSLVVLYLNMITSRNISSPGILFSTFPGGMNLLLLIQCLVTHLPSMMVLPWPNSLFERTLECVMLIEHKPETVHQQTLTISRPEVLWIPS